MKSKAILLLVIALVSLNSYGEEYFQDCSKVLDKPQYSILKAYINDNNELAEYCQRLNNTHFLYISSKEYNLRLMYCSKKADASLACDTEPFPRVPNYSVKERFYGKNNKQYVLFIGSVLSGGILSAQYVIFYLAPYSVSQKGFIIASLPGSAIKTGADSEAGFTCANIQGIASEYKPIAYTIKGDGTENPSITFHKEITDCDQKSPPTDEDVTYIYYNYRFKELKR